MHGGGTSFPATWTNRNRCEIQLVPQANKMRCHCSWKETKINPPSRGRRRTRDRWEDTWGCPRQSPLCQFGVVRHSGRRGSVHPACLRQCPALMDDPVRCVALLRWQGPINKQIVGLRSFVCYQHEVLFFIISEPQIINTHKPNDAWLLLQSLSH